MEKIKAFNDLISCEDNKNDIRSSSNPELMLETTTSLMSLTVKDTLREIDDLLSEYA